MQALLKTLLIELNSSYFKPQGFKKKAGRFERELEGVIQEVEFQSSQWNISGEAITFYVNISIGFPDIPAELCSHRLTGQGRIGELVADLPPQYDLLHSNFSDIKGELTRHLPDALRVLPLHYKDVKQRAKCGWMTSIPLPESWRTEAAAQSTDQTEQDGGGNSAALRASP